MHDPQQLPLVSEDIYEALTVTVQALGGTTRVGTAMRPELANQPSKARTWLANCLNSERAERLDPEQVLWLLDQARREGCHVAMHFICAEAGYAPPVPLEPEDEKAELQRQVVAATKSLGRMIGRLESLERGSSLSAVS